MGIKKVLCLGDSITAGVFASSPEFMYQPQLLTLLNQNHPEHDWRSVEQLPPGGSGTYMGSIWLLWDQFRRTRPDLVVLGGIGDNDTASTLSETIDAIGPASDTVVADANWQAGRAYILTDGTDEEVIIPQTASTVTGTRVVRGCMGTTARSWPAATTIRAWANKAAAPWADTMEYILKDVMNTDGRTPVVLVGGQVFEALTGAGNVATAALVADLHAEGYSQLEYCPYADADGNSLFAAGAKTAYTGPATTLAADMADDDTTLTVADNTEIQPGHYILVTSATGTTAPAKTDSEIMLVASKDGNTITVDATGTRNKLASPAARAFSTGDRVCTMSTVGVNPRHKWADIGDGGFSSYFWGYDRHPNDAGFIEIAKSMYRGFVRVNNRIGWD